MAPGCIAPMCIRVQDHSTVMCEQLQQLRQQTGLVDLDIVCEGHYIKVHKVVMAACSKFFKEQLCKFNVQALVILRLEDFGLELKRDAVNYIIEFIYSGEVNILGEKLTDFCQAAHTLGVLGLEHLPVPAARHGPTYHHKEHIQIADESELCGEGGSSLYPVEQITRENSKLPLEVNPFLNSFNPHHMNSSGPSSDEIILLHSIEREDNTRNEVSEHQDIIPISFGESGDCVSSEQYRNIQEILPRHIPEMLHLQEQNFQEEWPGLFSSHIPQSQDISTVRIHSRQLRTVVSCSGTMATGDMHLGIPGSQASLQALFDAASGDLCNTTTVKTISMAGKPDSPAPIAVSAPLVSASPQQGPLLSAAAGGKQLKPFDSKHFGSSAAAADAPGGVGGKFSPGKSLSQGKLRVINQGLPQSENIQTPSLAEQHKARRRSGHVAAAHAQTGHIPSQVALSAQVAHNHASGGGSAASAMRAAGGVRLLSVAAAGGGPSDPEAEEHQPIAEEDSGPIAEEESGSETDEETESIANTGLSTPLGNWSEETWPTSTRHQNNWTHPVESVHTATVPTTGAIWQLPQTNPTPTKLPPNSTQSWSLPPEPAAETPLLAVSRNTAAIPWNTPVTTAWCSRPATEMPPTKWERPLATQPSATDSTCSRDTPPNMTVAWTQPQTSASPTHAGAAGNTAAQQGEAAESNSSFSGGELTECIDTSQDSQPWDDENNWNRNITGSLSDDMLAIRSGIPLALQNKAIRSGVPIGPFQTKRKRKSRSQDSTKSKKRISVSIIKGDLEVRKDLTIESQQQEILNNIIHDHQDESGPSTSSVQPTRSKDPLSPLGGGVHIKTVKKLNSEYSCDKCDDSFYSAGQLQQHNLTTHKEEELFCQVCPQECDGKESLKVHLYKSHGIGQVFRCEECSFETPSKPGYIKHISDHIPPEEKQKKCVKCEKIFKTKYGLKLHLKEHFDERLACKVCDFQTAQKSNLTKHMASKHSQDIDGRLLEEVYQCNKCEFRCVTDHILKNHQLRKHTEKDQMRFQCDHDHCSYATVEKAALDKHRRFKHTNERPFMCNTCGFSTATASSMARHRRSHSQTKPHKCDICGHEYADKKRLRDHMYLHSDFKPFQCQLCTYTCRRNDNLTAHIKKHHEVPKVESELKAVIPDSTSEQTENFTQTQGVKEVSKMNVPCSSVLAHSISTIEISDIAE